MARFGRELLSLAAILGSAACAGGAPSADTTPHETPAITVRDVDAATTAVPSATVAPSATAAAPTASAAPSESGSPASPASPASPEATACGGADVDLAAVLANKRCRTPRDAPASPPGAAKDLKITLTPSASKVAPGGHIDLELAIVNTSSAPIPLYFSGDLTLAVEVKDGKGARIAPPAGNAPKNADAKCTEVNCRLPTSHVVVAAGGKAHARLGWDAKKVAWPKVGPSTCCTIHVDPVPKAPLAAGAYRLKVPLPYESNQGNPVDPEIEIRVGKF